ncbi:uncharacterized protein LOC126456731 [Schistocerca serialis cubense]|uniref:uncharacterized protein LOC126456731 n=1 Tax=Schistocerca serialis cubense TaxID=2023355 RepID=UPI00214ED9C7|nr:uncharacterized protein LOC126456731 [Schistocerca serialis cubense]
MSATSQFAEVQFERSEAVRLKNVKTEHYVCVRSVGSKHVLEAKPLHVLEDDEVTFKFYFYRTADIEDTQLVLPRHEATQKYISMDKKYRLNLKDDPYETPRSPEELKEADNRFFYIKFPEGDATRILLEGMNGLRKRNYFLAAGENLKSVVVKMHDGDVYPEDIMFFYEKVTDNHINSV